MAKVPSDGGQLTREAAPQEKAYNRDKVLEAYEAELRTARRWARTIGMLHNISQFLAFCNLTWATVALLGAFLPDLAPLDFGFVTSLLFIEAGRLASASFFLHLLRRPLAYGSDNPEKIKHGALDKQFLTALCLRHFSHFVQCIFIAPGIVLPVLGHIFLRSYSDVLNLNSSLRIFYSFVAFNSFVAIINLICSVLAFQVLNKKPVDQSISSYFDTVLEKAISSDLLRADVFEFFSFAYTILGDDFRRKIPPKDIAKNYTRLIKYLNASRLEPDALMTHMDAGDPFVQLAAMNMVGFWTSEELELPEKEWNLSEGLLTKLADKVGSKGQLGWAAATSFNVLARTQKGAQLVEETRTSRDIGLLDWVVRQVNDSSNRSLALVRMLVTFYAQKCVSENYPPALCGQDDKLVEKLAKLAKEAKVQRLRVLAAYLMFVMPAGAFNEDVVKAIKVENSSYWFKSEIQMLALLCRQIPDAPPVNPNNYPDAKQDSDLTVPRWAQPNPSATRT